MKNFVRPAFGSFSVILGGVAIIVALQFPAAGKEAPASPKVSVQETPLSRDVKAATSLAPVIKRVAPSVVNIYSTRTIRMQQMLPPWLDVPTLRRFFGGRDDGRDDGRRGRRSQPQKSQSLGSGVIVSEDGYILTNNHVVEGADKDGVEVALADGKTKYTAKVVGTDPHTEVAILKVDAKKLPAITLTDSDKLEVGDLVLAVGNPFGVGQSVTKGIISALGRGNLPGGRVTDYEDFIQVDAPINPGNSGGPLVDAEGRLIGINTFIASSSGASAGVGFAIPINLAKSVMDRLLKDGKVTRGYLGVSIQPVTPELAKEFKLPDESGALIGGVNADTPAAEAGLKEGDVIVEFNGKKVNDFTHLRLMVSQTAPETKVALKIFRDGREKAMTATVGEMSEDETMAKRGKPQEKAEPKVDALDGVEVTDVDSSSRKEFEIPDRLRGALVTKVDPDSEAYAAELRPGDVILEINRQPVRGADEAVELSGKVEGRRVLLRVWSNGGTRYLVVNNSKRK